MKTWTNWLMCCLLASLVSVVMGGCDPEEGKETAYYEGLDAPAFYIPAEGRLEREFLDAPAFYIPPKEELEYLTFDLIVVCEDDDECEGGQICNREWNYCVQCLDDVDCSASDDTDHCNGEPACIHGYCVTQPGSTVVCPIAGNDCSTFECEPSTGDCVEVYEPDGDSCDYSSRERPVEQVQIRDDGGA
jgi:hypothetical protein